MWEGLSYINPLLDTIDLVINPTYVSLCVNPPLILSGIIVLLVSIVLMLAGFLAFWTVAVAGIGMVLWGLLSEKREEIVPEDPNMKFCWYCLREIPIDAEVCAYCGLRQEPLKRQ